MRKLLQTLAKWLAVLGGVVVCSLAVLTTVSVLSRWLMSKPIQGDVELTQFGVAMCVACFLPWCQVKCGNIIVDFFTTKLTARTRSLLDGVGALLLALMLGLLAWRTGVGAISNREAGETTMILGLPMWWSYAGLVPGLTLTALIALEQAIGYFRNRADGRSA